MQNASCGICNSDPNGFQFSTNINKIVFVSSARPFANSFVSNISHTYGNPIAGC
jgi:hypothetical protein